MRAWKERGMASGFGNSGFLSLLRWKLHAIAMYLVMHGIFGF
jgi:hypothetical protein